MPGTRRLEELIADARSLSYTEDYSSTEGWNDDTLARIFNMGLSHIYQAVTTISNPGNIEEASIDVVAGQEEYDIPIDVMMAVRIVDVRFIWGEASWQFVTLRQGTIADRYSYPTNIPDMYCIRNGKILLTPVPSVSKTGALVINYQKRMRDLDIRRGELDSIDTDPSVTLTLTFPTNSKKLARMKENAKALDMVDYCCLVNSDGEPVVSAIPIESYSTSTYVITCPDTYAFTAAEEAAIDEYLDAGTPLYVVSGRYSSTHSQLDMECEKCLVDYAVARLLQLQSSSQTPAQERRVKDSLDALVWSYRRNRPSAYRIDFSNRYFRRSFPFGSQGIV